MSERLLTTQEVAERLGVSPRTVLRWARERKIPSVKVGRATRYYWSRIEHWLEQGARGPDLSSRLDSLRAGVHAGRVSDKGGGHAGKAEG